MRGLAVDLAPIRINAVCPGIVMTEVVADRPASAIRAMVETNPIQRAATPAEAAQAYVYFKCSEYSSGLILPVDGGGLLV